jgi:hypothetical protein
LNVRTLALEISWLSVVPPVEPTNAKANCLGTPAASQVGEGYRPAATVGSGPLSVRAVCPTGVTMTL